MPSISVLLPVYNAGSDLHRAIQSILNQSYRDIEIIAIDDGSSDNSGQILDQYSKIDSRLRVFHQENAGALGKTLNIAAEHAHGKYLVRHDADDVSHPIRIENQIKYLEAHPDVGLCGIWTWYIDSDLGPLYSLEIPDNHKKMIAYLRTGKNPIVHGSVMMQSSIFQLLNGYRGSFAEDFDLWLRFSEVAKLGMCTQVGYYFWRSVGGITTGAHSRQKALIGLYKKLNKEREKFNKEITDWDEEYNKIIHIPNNENTTEEREASMHYSRGMQLLRIGLYAQAKHEFFQASTVQGVYANKARRNLKFIQLAPLMKVLYYIAEIDKPGFYARPLSMNTPLPDFAVK